MSYQAMRMQQGAGFMDAIKSIKNNTIGFLQKYQPATYVNRYLRDKNLKDVVDKLPGGSIVNKALDYGEKQGFGQQKPKKKKPGRPRKVGRPKKK